MPGWFSVRKKLRHEHQEQKIWILFIIQNCENVFYDKIPTTKQKKFNPILTGTLLSFLKFVHFLFIFCELEIISCASVLQQFNQ